MGTDQVGKVQERYFRPGLLSMTGVPHGSATLHRMDACDLRSCDPPSSAPRESSCYWQVTKVFTHDFTGQADRRQLSSAITNVEGTRTRPSD